MPPKYSVARPKRAGEIFARQHHGEKGDDKSEADGRKLQFDVRNPSALAPDAREEDEMLEADVIGVGMAATKRGAVNIDGYDSDSDNETFKARAEKRVKKKGSKKKSGSSGEAGGRSGDGDDVTVDLADQLDNYDKRLKAEASGGAGGGAEEEDEDDDDDDDMFGDNSGDDGDEKGGKGKKAKKGAGGFTDVSGKKAKEVRFLDDALIEGQEEESKGGGHIHINSESESESDEDNGGRNGTKDDDDDDEEVDEELAVLEEGLDEEVGPGGSRRHAPKVEAFNMKTEQEEGAFDEDGNYVRKAADPDAQHDRWLEGISEKQMKRARAAHEKREAELRQQRRAEDSLVTADLLASLITRLEPTETALEALARLGRGMRRAKKAKRVPKWRQQKKKVGEGENSERMDVDENDKEKEKERLDPETAQRKRDIDAITDAADHLLNREYADIYDTEREKLMREYRNETGEAWVEPRRQVEDEAEAEEATAPATASAGVQKMWQFRWIDKRDGGIVQGPFEGAMMKAWQDAGYFGEGVEFRPVGEPGWTRAAAFV